MDEDQGQPVSGAELLDVEGETIIGATKNADGTVTLLLEKPIKVMGANVETITLRRPTGAEMRGLDAKTGPIEASMRFLAKAANLPPPCVDLMDGADIQAAGAILKVFMRKTRGLGAN